MRIRRAGLAVAMALAAIVFPSLASAVDDVDWGLHLLRQGEASAARLTFDRLLFLDSEHPRAGEIALYAGIAAARAGDLDGAWARLSPLTEVTDAALALAARIQIGEAMFAAGEWAAAERAYAAAATLAEGADAEYLRFRRIWVAIARADLEQALRRWQSFGLPQTVPIDAAAFGADLQALIDRPRKYPTLAGVLSILPGLGQLYAGHLGDALSAFLVNGALAAATVIAVSSEAWGLTVLSGTLLAAFWSGNIYGAVTQAREADLRREVQALERLKARGLVHRDPLPDPPTLWLRYGLDFR